MHAIHATSGSKTATAAATKERPAPKAEKAKRIIDAVPHKHPFEVRYKPVERVAWESCAEVLQAKAKLDVLKQGW